MQRYKVILVGGARPNFVKIAPLYHAFLECPRVQPILINTGQHLDKAMSTSFFEDFELPISQKTLLTHHGSTTSLTAQILTSFEQVIEYEDPDLVVVTGDVTSTLACALSAMQKNIPVAHVEAGLRSGDKTMPEEMNRILTDQIAALLFTSEPTAKVNLLRENREEEKIHFVGNVMIDTLIRYPCKADPPPYNYVLVTMHRPSNVDNRLGMQRIVDLIEAIAEIEKVIFVVHPRTKQRLQLFSLWDTLSCNTQVELLPPQSYFAFRNLVQHTMAVLTDSGGIQEETTYLNIPCLTFRKTTERPVTVEKGTNYLISDLNITTVITLLKEIQKGNCKLGEVPELWDGRASQRIVEVIVKYLEENS